MQYGRQLARTCDLGAFHATAFGDLPGDVNGYAVEEVPFRAIGFDEGVYLCLH